MPSKGVAYIGKDIAYVDTQVEALDVVREWSQ
jgi:hypothetical protein